MENFVTQVHKWVAHTSVSSSTVRGQRTPGLVAGLRDLLASVDLKKMAGLRVDDFADFLDEQTQRIKHKMPPGGRCFGIARKGLNIFLRGATYNCFLREEFKLHRFESRLEIPLDSLTAKGIRSESPKRSLPPWCGVKHLTPEVSAMFQKRAAEIAAEKGLARVHLDIFLWLDRD